MPSNRTRSMTDRTLIIIGIVTGAVMIAFITAVAIKADRNYSPLDILWIDGALALGTVFSTWRGLGRLRKSRRQSQQDT